MVRGVEMRPEWGIEMLIMKGKEVWDYNRRMKCVLEAVSLVGNGFCGISELGWLNHKE